MCKALVFLAAFISFFQVTEGITSQVIYQDMVIPLERLVNDVDNIVVVKSSDQWEIFLERSIPKKAGLPPPDEVYREHAYLYEVVSVLKSKTIVPGQIIKVWDPPIFSYEELKTAYEKNLRRSPIISVYKPHHEPAKGQNFILMLADKEVEKSVFRRVGEEGLATQSEIKKILKAPQ